MGPKPVEPDPPPAVDPALRACLSRLFDAAFYSNALAARGLSLGDADPLEHYLREGDAALVPPHPLFDPAFYAERNPDVAAAGANKLRHYLAHGYREERDPHPLFDLKLVKSQLAADFGGDPLIAYLQSRGAELTPHRLFDPDFFDAQLRRLRPNDQRPSLLAYFASDPELINPSADFDGAAYRRRYPESEGLNPLVHYVLFGEASGLQASAHGGPLGAVVTDIEAAAGLDPDIVKPFADPLATPVFPGYDIVRRELRLYRCLVQAAGRLAYSHVILTPWLKRGGADRAVLHLTRALLENDAEARVLIVCTQDDALEALDWAPPTRRLTVARVARYLDERHDTFAAFCNFLRFAECRHLYVVNSRFGWDAIEKYGHALRPRMRLYGFAFCHDYDDAGRRAGYAWTRLGRAIDNLDALVSDNGRTISEFAADHAFDAVDLAKLAVLPLPVDERLYRAAEQSFANLAQGERRRHQVFWAGRFTTQKALDVAIETARLLTNVDICAFGGDDASGPSNFRVGGAFDDFAELPLHQASLFLHTARWEGLPNVVLEAGAAGLPVIARDVGGVGELIDETTGWLIPRNAGASAFAEAISDALARPEEAIARARRLQQRIGERHTPAAFARAVERLLTFRAGAA